MEDRAEGGNVGGHIQYETGISLDDKQREYWSLYTAENNQKYFWIFLNSFVEKWEQKVFSISSLYCRQSIFSLTFYENKMCRCLLMHCKIFSNATTSLSLVMESEINE